MIKELIERYSQSPDKKRLLRNILSLSLLQGANYILPLLTVPYLIRTIGLESFGLLAFATAAIMYVAILTDYGFNLSATRQISIHRNNREMINRIFSAVMYVKICLMIIGFAIILFLVIFINKFNQNWEVYILTFGVVIGQVLFPIWLFQGLELMSKITYINIMAKLIFTILIFALVKSGDDYLFVPAFTALGSIIAGLFSIYIIVSKMNYRFIACDFNELKSQLKDGWHIFISSIAISLYTVSTTFILGVLANSAIVGQFAAVDKIIQAARGLYQPISQSLYPLMGKMLSENKFYALAFIKKIAIVVLAIMAFVSFTLFYLSDFIINLFLGGDHSDAVFILKIMSPLPFVIALSNILGIQLMLNLGLKSAFANILIMAAFLGISLCFVLIPFYDARGAAITLIFVETFVTVVMLIYVWSYIRKLK